MNVTFSIAKTLVWPEKNAMQNVVGIVYWECTFERNGATSKSGGETLLDVPTDTFIPFDQLTEQQIVEWVIAKEGGVNFINMLKEINEPYLAYAESQMGLVEVKPSFLTPAVVQIFPTKSTGKITVADPTMVI